MNWFSRLFRRKSARFPSYERDGSSLGAASPPAGRRGPSAPDSSLPGFSASASLLDHRGTRATMADRQHSYRRAFLPSQPVHDATAFAGRTELLRRVIRAIEDQHLHVVLYGDRGIGKTSVLRVVHELAGKANYVVQYASCGEDTDFCELFRSIAARVPLLYDAQFDPTIEAVERGGSLADRLPAGPFTVSQLSDVMANIAGTRVLLILDEFDRAASVRFRNSVAELIKNLSDRSIRVQLLIAGVAANLNDLIAHVPSIRRNIVGIGVPNMTNDEVRELVAIGERVGHVRMADDAVARLVAGSAGLPYIAALIGQHATLVSIEDGAAEISAAHVDTAFARAQDDILSRLSPSAAYILARPGHLAPESVFVTAANEAVMHGGQIANPAITAALAELVEPESAMFTKIVDNLEGAWRFSEDGVSSYIWLAAGRNGAKNGA
ncbi:MAG: ATP-binding protein [Sphingopyxis sp.]